MKLKFLTALLAGMLWCAQGRADNLTPPDLLSISALSCSIHGMGVNKDGGPWETTATAEYANVAKHHGGKPWELLLSERKSLRDATDDCARWMKQVRAAQTKLQDSGSRG